MSVLIIVEFNSVKYPLVSIFFYPLTDSDILSNLKLKTAPRASPTSFKLLKQD